MRTSKPFSTISYNTDKFLQEKLNALIKQCKISFYAYVEHYAEEDETKNHKHLLIVPNGLYNTDDLTEILTERDLNNVLQKPLGVMPWRSSKFGDWYLYCTHNVEYLLSKGQARHYHYEKSDFITSDSDYLTELIHEIDFSKYTKQQEVIQALSQGASFADLLARGIIPVAQFNQWKNCFDFLRNNNVFRNERKTHSPKVDEDTGEIYEEYEETNEDLPFTEDTEKLPRFK